MKQWLPLLCICFAIFCNSNSYAQNFKLSRYITATDTITDEGVTLAVSSDDAEQENDEIDALFDDDIDAGWEGEPDDLNILTAGLRFQNIFIPKGATIDSAFIFVHSHEAKTADDVARITIVAEATDNATTFTEDALITDRSATTASLLWVVDQPWGLWTKERTPNLREIVQEVVDREGWQAGNAIAFILKGEDQGPSEVENAREFESFENISDPEDGGDGQNKPERIPELVIFYSVKSALVEVPVIATDTITDEGVTLAVSSDDAEQENNEIDALFDDDLDAGWEGEPDDLNILTAGIRFQNIFIPQGAVIDSAFIEVHSHEAKTADDVARITIVAEATDNATTFTEDALITDRSATTASLLWVVDQPWGLWTKERTPNLREIVQEIVNREGWQAGNAIAFILKGEDQGPSEVENAREFESYENISDPEDGGDGQNKPERVPRLFVYYSSSNTTVSIKQLFAPEVETLKVYPNPANDFATIELASTAAATIHVFDVNGRLVNSVFSNASDFVNLNTSNLSNGIYYVQAKQDGKLFVQKLIVQ